MAVLIRERGGNEIESERINTEEPDHLGSYRDFGFTHRETGIHCRILNRRSNLHDLPQEPGYFGSCFEKRESGSKGSSRETS